MLEMGATVTVTTDEARSNNGDAVRSSDTKANFTFYDNDTRLFQNTIFVDYKNLPKIIKVGDKIFIDDGMFREE